jgi:predicted RNase H-like nuclease
VDGFRGGWVGALVASGTVRWRVMPDARGVVDASTATRACAVDAPIGLPDSGPRDCDLAARALLGRRGVSVFPAPVRAVLAASSYEDACRRSRAAQGTALSLQTWHITDKIRDLDAALEGRPDAVVECHPEVSFTLLAGAPLPPKRSADGREARVRALSAWVDVPSALADAPRGPRTDDLLDALVCAWSAERMARGEAVRLPGGPLQRDRLGRPMQIVC